MCTAIISTTGLNEGGEDTLPSEQHCSVPYDTVTVCKIPEIYQINQRRLILSRVNYYALVTIIALWMKLVSSEQNKNTRVSYFSIRLTFLTELKKMFKEKFLFISCNVRNSCHFPQLWDEVHLCFEI